MYTSNVNLLTSNHIFIFQIHLSGSDVLNVKRGDSFGFTWLATGVIDFDVVNQANYCENHAKFDVGNQVNLVANRHGKRAYSIMMYLSTCQSPPPPPPCFGKKLQTKTLFNL